MRKNLKMRCQACGHWNRVPVNKVVIEQNSPELRLKSSSPCMTHYKSLNVKNAAKSLLNQKSLSEL